ncbi:MAG TPA: RNA polymerase sigma factor [Terriglobales bacterium]|nr:RNA polymerase sigma factor [Terriglobales bacterium]
MLRVQAGDDAALGKLLERYGRTVLNIGVRVLRDHGEAQELVQDVFLHVFKKAQLFDPKRGSFRAWVCQIASHRAFDRREYLNLHRFYDDRNLDDFVEVIRAACDLEYQAAVRQNESRLRSTFNELSDKQRATLELYFFEGYTLREISERLNESLGNIRHYYYRALNRLRASVTPVNGEHHDS